jgi:hypothetical protein
MKKQQTVVYLNGECLDFGPMFDGAENCTLSFFSRHKYNNIIIAITSSNIFYVILPFYFINYNY